MILELLNKDRELQEKNAQLWNDTKKDLDNITNDFVEKVIKWSQS